MSLKRGLLLSCFTGFIGGMAVGSLALSLYMRFAQFVTPTEKQACRWYIPLAKMTYNLFFRETPAPDGIINDGWCKEISTL